MPKYAIHSEISSIFDKKIAGYAAYYNYYRYDPTFIIYLIYLVVSGLVSLFLILGLSTPLFVTIVESIETTENGKPKLYYISFLVICITDNDWYLGI